MTPRPVGTRTIIWRGGEDDFCIARVVDVFALEEKCGAGLGEILNRLELGLWKLNDIRETIRLGLMGGGKSPEEAMRLVKLHVDQNPNGFAPSVMIAHAIIEAALIGVKDDPVGKTAAAEATDPRSTTMTDASAAPQSMGSEQVSDGQQERPTSTPSGNSPPASTDTIEQTRSMISVHPSQ